MKFSIKRQVAFGFTASLTALLCLGFISYRTISQLIQTQDLVAHTHQVIATLETGKAILTEAETAQRGYLLTADDRFLADTQAAQQQVAGWEKKLRLMTQDNPVQQAQLDRLEPLITKRIDILNNRIKVRQERGMEAAMAAVKSREGKSVMEQIWHNLDELREVENKLLAERTEAAQARSQQSIQIIVAGGILACVVGIFATWLILHSLKVRERVEAELQKSRAQLQGILDNAPALVFIKGLDGRYLFVNRLFTEISRLHRDQIEGKTTRELFGKAIADTAQAHTEAIIKAGGPQQFEESVIYPDGPRTHLAIKFPLRDQQGKIYATSGISTDISERKRAEEERDRFFTLTRDFLCIAGLDGYFKRVNPAWETTFGYSNEEMVSQPFINFVHPDDRERTVAEASNLAGGKETLSFENRYRCKDGTYRWLLWNARPMIEHKLMYCSARDVTDRKFHEDEIQKLNAALHQRAAQLEVANKELEAFSYSVSHDLRAPLRHIDGFVGLLAKQINEKLDSRGQRYLTVIASSAKQMGTLIDDLLVFCRMGRVELREQNVDMDLLVKEAIAAENEASKDRAIQWKVAKLPPVQADAAMLRQVIVNLISNAVKYSRPRQSAVIEIGCLSETPLEFTFFVRDNGVGFDMQYADKLFGVFQRLHHSDEFEGTGIGLANVRRIIHRHGGRTWAEGTIDHGAVFYFSLPKHIIS